MEKKLAHLKLNGLELSLTNEKIHIQSNVSQEAIALRSVYGIGVIDLVDRYNKELTAHKALKQYVTLGIFLMVMSVVAALMLFYLEEILAALIVGGVFFLAGIIYYTRYNDTDKPSLKSAVRIMITGTQRDFEFDKAQSNATDVANFVAQVENTLSAFHKN